MRIITISREFGSGGRELGKRLADHLGYDYYDSEIIAAVASKSGMDAGYVEKTLNNHQWQNYRFSFRGTLGSAPYLRASQVDLLLLQKKVIEDIAGMGENFVVVGESAFASINLIMPYCMIFSSIGSVFGVGGSALVAKIKGEGDDDKANRIFTLLIHTMFILGVILTVVAQLLLPSAARWMGATDELMDNCLIYARIFLITQAAFFLQYGLQSLMITAERPKLGLLFTIAAGVSNMILDWLFIAVFHWGVAGAAIASCVGQCIGGFGPVIYFALAKDCPLRLVRTRFMPKELLKSAGNGASEGITNVAMSLVNMVYNFQLMKYIGEYGVSAFGVIMYVNFVFSAVYIGYSMGTAPVFSFHYGAGETDELKSLFKKSMIIVSIFSVTLTSLAIFSARGIASIFASYDEAFLLLTTKALRMYAISYFFAGINIFGANLFAALNDGLTAGALSGLRIFVFQLIAIFVLPLILGSDGIWLAMFVAECCVLVITIVVLVKGRKRYRYA